jgi:hypothetical protein
VEKQLNFLLIKILAKRKIFNLMWALEILNIQPK